MARCRACGHRFSVLEDEDDGQHGCPACGYGDAAFCPAPWTDDDEDEDDGAAYVEAK